MGCVWNFLIESCGYIAKSRVSRCNSKFDLHPGPKVGQIILKDSPIILLLVPKFSAHYSSIILKQYHAASQELIAMTCASKFNPKTTVFLCIQCSVQSTAKFFVSI